MTGKKLFALLAGGVATLALAAGARADNSMGGSMGSMDHMTSMGKQVTITGVVTDLSCFVGSGLHGPTHAVCAKACIAQGQEMGIKLDNGTIVQVFGKGPNDHMPNAKLSQYAEERVTVTGTEYTGHGITGIRIDTVKAAM